MTVNLPPAYQFMTEPARFKVVYGGRGKAATWSFAILAVLMAVRQNVRVLCTREIQRSIKDSVHKVLADTVVRLGYRSEFAVTKEQFRNRVTGAEFMFKGLRSNAEEIKSTEGIDICWLGEARNTSRSSLDWLIPTVRKEDVDLWELGPGVSEFWIDFNPELEDDPIYQDFVINKREGAEVRHMTYRDNPWFPEVLRQEMEWCKKTDYERYLWIWEGQCRKVSEAQVFNGCFREDTFAMPKHVDGGPYYGVDWGFSVDPTTCIRAFVKDQTLFIDHEAYGVHVDLDAMPALFDQVPGSREYTMTADSARPEMIHELNGRGFYIKAARKGQGSVEDGIAHIRSYKEVVIHPRCRHTLEEFKLYSHKLDPLTGNPTPKLEDKHNHCIDALRYALEDVSRSVSVAFI